MGAGRGGRPRARTRSACGVNPMTSVTTERMRALPAIIPVGLIHQVAASGRAAGRERVPDTRRPRAAVTQSQCIARCTPTITSIASDETECILLQNRSGRCAIPICGSATSETTTPETITTASVA